MTRRKTLVLFLMIALIVSSVVAMNIGAVAEETVPTTAIMVDPGWWPSYNMSVTNDGADGVKVVFPTGTPWGLRAVGQQTYELNELEVTFSKINLLDSSDGIFFNFADASTNPASDPGGTSSMYLFLHPTSSGYDLNIIRRPGDVYLTTLSFMEPVPADAILKFEQQADLSWKVIFNNKEAIISASDMDAMIPNQSLACFSIGNASGSAAEDISINLARVRNVAFRTDLKPGAANFQNPWWGGMVVITEGDGNGTGITLTAEAWGPRAIGQDVFNLQDLEVTLTNFSMPNPDGGIFVNFADYDLNTLSDPATGGLFFYVKNSESGFAVELFQRPDTYLGTFQFGGTAPSTIKLGFIKNLDTSWTVRVNERSLVLATGVMEGIIPNTGRACFSIGNNNVTPESTSMNVSSIKYLDPAAAPTSTPTEEPTPTSDVTPTPEPTPIINTNVDVPNEGDFLNPFWPDEYIMVTPLDQERGILVEFPGSSAWGVRAVGTQGYVLDGLEMDLTEFSLSGANRQFILVIADAERNPASDPSSRSLLLVYSLDEESGNPVITFWARPFYEGDEPLLVHSLDTDITDHIYLKFNKVDTNWNIELNGETMTIADDVLRASIPNPELVKFAPGFGATDENGLSFIISRVTNKVVFDNPEEPTPEATATEAASSDDSSPETGENGTFFIFILAAILAAGVMLTLKNRTTAVR